MIKNITESTDKIFSDYMVAKINNKELEDHLASCLSSMYDCNKLYKVYIVDSPNEPMFFMRITPNIDQSDEILNEIKNEKISFKDLRKRWGEMENWNLEIDSRCLDRNEINFNPQELTALLIHEIGHVIFSDRPIERFYREYNEAKLKFTLADRAKFKFVSFLYMIPLYTASIAHDFGVGKNGILEEKKCDALTKQFGYEKFLISACSKIIKNYGSAVFKNNNELDKQLEKDFIWCNSNITELIERKHELKNELVYKTIKTKSSPFKAMYMKLISKIGIYLKDKKTGLAMESSIDSMDNIDLSEYEICVNNKLANIERYFSNFKSSNEIAQEVFFLNKKKNKKIDITEYDIDAVEIESDRIENHHDRIFVLDLIYELLEKIDIIEELSETDTSIKAKYKSKIKRFRDRLYKIRNKVLKKKDFEKEYKLFISVPKGYEG